MNRDEQALDSHRLLPRLLRGVERVDSSTVLGGLELTAPLIPLLQTTLPGHAVERAIVPASLLLDNPHNYRSGS